MTWLQREQSEVLTEMKRKEKPGYSNKLFGYFCIILIPLLAMSVCYTTQPYLDDVDLGDGHAWRCRRCHNNVWTDQCDWAGNYYCPRCGTKAGCDD